MNRECCCVYLCVVVVVGVRRTANIHMSIYKYYSTDIPYPQLHAVHHGSDCRPQYEENNNIIVCIADIKPLELVNLLELEFFVSVCGGRWVCGGY
jgi:hypothetical protein